MTERCILILGNSGSGKTTMARALQDEFGLPHLDLDAIAWAEPGERLPLAESVAALPLCTEFRFLNPSTEACVANCQARPWEPEKYASPKEQDERLAFLLDWARGYETRGDEYRLAQHRALFDGFDGFDGVKREYAGAV